MPVTNTRTNYVTLYRTFAEMYENLDFIQTLERLKTGEPTSMHGSSSSAKIDGTNRPLSRLAHGLDSVLDQMMVLKTIAVEAADSTYITWNGTNVVSNGTITCTVNLIAAGQISGAPDGKIEYTIAAFTKNMSTADWGYVRLPMDPTGSTTLTITPATDADLQTQLGGPNRMKILPIFYKNTSGQIVWMLGGRQAIHQGYNFYPGTYQNRFYSKNDNVQAVGNISVSGSGNVSWIKNGSVAGRYDLTLPNLTVTGPSISQTVAGASYNYGTADELEDGFALFIDVSDGSVSVEDLNTSDFSNSDDLRVLVCARDGNDVYFWNGLKLVGTTTASTGTTVDLFNFQQQLVRLIDNGTSFYLDLLSNSDANFTDNRSLTLDVGNADRTLVLKGTPTYTFNATSFSVEGSVSTAVNSTLQLNDTCSLDLQGTSSNPSSITLNQATIDLEQGCTIDLDTTSSITADNSTLNLGTGNAVSIGANLTTTAALTVSSACTIDQNVSTSSSPSFSTMTLLKNSAAQYPALYFNKSNGTSSTPSNVTGSLMVISGSGYNEYGAGSYEEGAFIKMTVTGAPDGSQADDVAAAITFGTSAGSGNASAEKMRLDADGNLGLGLINPSSRLHIEGPITAPLLSIKPDAYNKPVDFNLDNDGNLDIETTSSAQVTINNQAIRVEEITITVSLSTTAVSTDGMVIPTLDSHARSSAGAYVQDRSGNSISDFSQYGLSDSQERAASMWTAPRDCTVVGYRFASEVSFGKYDATGELNDGTNDYPGFGVISSWNCPDDVKVDLRVVAFKLDPNAALTAGGFYTAPVTSIDYVGNAYQKFLYGSIFDSTNSLGTGATTGTGSSFYAHYAGREIEGTFVAPLDVSAGEGLLILLNDPSGTADSSPANQSFTSRQTTAGSSVSNPWVKITILVEYPV